VPRKKTDKNASTINLLAVDLLTKAENGFSAAIQEMSPVATVQLQAPSQLLLERIEVENLWCYEKASLDWGQGITVIAGSNGSGKSSLLESVFFALYGSEAGAAMGRPLDGILRLGSQEGFVTLHFWHDGKKYQAQMALRRRLDQVVSERDESVLTNDQGERWVGVREVVSQIEKLFGMSRDDFVNCLYVRQGEIDRLIRAGDEERKQMIDRLLRLEKLDTYSHRVKDGAQRAVNRELGGLQRGQKELKKNIESYEAMGLEAKRLELTQQIEKLQLEIQARDAKLSEVEQLKAHFDEQFKNLEQASKEIFQAQQEISNKEQKLKQSAQREEQLSRELKMLEQRYRDLERHLDDGLKELSLDSQKALESLAQADTFEQMSILPEELTHAKAKIEAAREQLETKRAEATAIDETLREERDKISQKLIEKRTQLKQLEQEERRHQELVELGKCPTCQQAISQQSTGESLQHINEHKTQLAEEIALTEAELKKHDTNRSAFRSKNQNEHLQVTANIKALEQHREKLDILKEKALLLLRTKDEGKQKREQRKTLNEGRDELRNDVTRLSAQIEEKKAQLINREELQTKIAKVQEHLKTLRNEKNQFSIQHHNLIHQRGTLSNQIQQLETWRIDLTRLSSQLESIETIQSELERMRELYQIVKKELRLRYMDKLNGAFQNFFNLMGAEDSYSGVRITDEYEIQVQLKDGGSISPALLSGGERALINIALRCAIHQVLSQEIRRMPLILDEPTVYLDRERVARLQRLLEDLGRRVGQVIIVSHEAGLVEGADHEYRTEKGNNNISSVRKVR
jgi:exonuclease SbcC